MRDPNNHGNIGEDAVDLSLSSIVSATNGATGAASIAMGQQTLASGNTSTALGINTTASELIQRQWVHQPMQQVASTAMGSATTASDFCSCNGSPSSASGPASIAWGKFYGIRSAYRCHGKKYNCRFLCLSIFGRIQCHYTGSNPTTWVATDPVFAIGVGTSDMNRKMQSLS
ncbi:MAG: hypothetical protein IPN10_01590 [Saprospiraceae bacterium]|nr:hypothetical protein [Saprospiraceae bacterium]